MSEIIACGDSFFDTRLITTADHRSSSWESIEPFPVPERSVRSCPLPNDKQNSHLLAPANASFMFGGLLTGIDRSAVEYIHERVGRGAQDGHDCEHPIDMLACYSRNHHRRRWSGFVRPVCMLRNGGRECFTIYLISSPSLFARRHDEIHNDDVVPERNAENRTIWRMFGSTPG